MVGCRWVGNTAIGATWLSAEDLGNDSSEVLGVPHPSLCPSCSIPHPTRCLCHDVPRSRDSGAMLKRKAALVLEKLQEVGVSGLRAGLRV